MKFGHPFTPYPPLVVNCCPTGMVPTRQMSPHVPLAADEIVAEAVALARAGAAILHLHARDETGAPTPSKEVYRRILCEVRQRVPEVILCVSTSGRLWSDFARRSEVLDLEGDARPDMASLTLGSMNFMRQASLNEPATIRDLARKMLDRGIKPEVEIFDLGMMDFAHRLVHEGLLPGVLYANILLGNLGTAPADLGCLSLIADRAPRPCVLSVAGLGAASLPVHMVALAAGMHVRVGLEDTLYM
ncbi:MAG TPA: 3-keto-5-aminohexanoate cleavage protein, partial [Candidatus Nitrosotenuis sp.]|nr:3-keto-5-aminohexanoate cleavage protein [Candidatus Nitrosotenuis sp.]